MFKEPILEKENFGFKITLLRLKILTLCHTLLVLYRLGKYVLSNRKYCKRHKVCMLKLSNNEPVHYLGGCACGVMVIVVGSGHGDTSSNPGRD